MKTYISLKNKYQFDKVYNCNQVKANKYLVIYICKNDSKINRIGLSISKKVGNSVIRHRVARLIRESYRLNSQLFKNGYDIVIVARNTIRDKSFHDVESALLHLFKLHSLILDEDRN